MKSKVIEWLKEPSGRDTSIDLVLCFLWGMMAYSVGKIFFAL
jgi:hypothetical protein